MQVSTEHPNPRYTEQRVPVLGHFLEQDLLHPAVFKNKELLGI